MLRYKTETRPGLVALYDIRPGNGAGQFLQPESPHGAPACDGHPASHPRCRSKDAAYYVVQVIKPVNPSSPGEMAVKLASPGIRE